MREAYRRTVPHEEDRSTGQEVLHGERRMGMNVVELLIFGATCEWFGLVHSKHESYNHKLYDAAREVYYYGDPDFARDMKHGARWTSNKWSSSVRNTTK